MQTELNLEIGSKKIKEKIKKELNQPFQMLEHIILFHMILLGNFLNRTRIKKTDPKAIT